jgi:hypothetical protein
MMLGLAAPASAVLGPITFTPDSGPIGCVVVITGTDFLGPDVDVVEFGGAAATFEIQSDTEIWASAPALGTGFITVEKTATGESVSSTSQFTLTTGAGACAPTITSFSPDCGLVGDTMTVTGTNLIDGTAFAGGLVEFSPFTGTPPTDGIDATPTGAAVDTMSLSVLVPSGAADGPISVTTDVSEAFSATDFNVVTSAADCVPVVTEHSRSITLKLRKHLTAKGKVTVTDDFTECAASVPVKIQRKKPGGGWKTVKNTTTSATGSYAKKIKDRPGKYRAKATKVTLESGDVCLKDVSPIVKHRH